jgi:hypothetical protein
MAGRGGLPAGGTVCAFGFLKGDAKIHVLEGLFFWDHRYRELRCARVERVFRGIE